MCRVLKLSARTSRRVLGTWQVPKPINCSNILNHYVIGQDRAKLYPCCGDIQPLQTHPTSTIRLRRRDRCWCKNQTSHDRLTGSSKTFLAQTLAHVADVPLPLQMQQPWRSWLCRWRRWKYSFETSSSGYSIHRTCFERRHYLCRWNW